MRINRNAPHESAHNFWRACVNLIVGLACITACFYFIVITIWGAALGHSVG
jgi:hypothetical protein